MGAANPSFGPSSYSDSVAAAHREVLRANQREQPTLSPTTKPVHAPDYSTSTMRIQTGLRTLDESLPNGQKVRSETALQLMRQGMEELAVWMRESSYRV